MSAIEELLRAKIVMIEADRDREAAKVDKLDKELADVKRERDDLKFVVDGHRPFNEWAQEYLDAGRWAGYRYCDGVMTELKERDEELASALKSNAHQADAYSSLNAAYQQLAEEYAKSKTDMERLDWLESQASKFEVVIEVGKSRGMYYDTVRDAIDGSIAARAAQEERK